ncbi:MAG: hypothetical protein KBT06_03035 [Prevotellaceae bacterium]|nr:hypothetical protein [Candidatus Colivivens equi]
MIEQGRYSEAQLLAALRSSARDVFYEYTLVDRQNKTIEKLDIIDGKITFDSSFPVMRTFTGTVHRVKGINLYSVDYRLVPWLCLNIGNDTVKWPLGKFLINPSENNMDGYKTYSIAGYDLGKIADMYYEDSRYFVETGTICTTNISELVSELYDYTDITPNILARNYANEWPIGSNRLDIINQMSEGIGYNPLWFNEVGCAMVKEYINPDIRPIDIVYSANEQSIITDGITRSTGMFEVPNKFVRWIENTDAPYVVSTYVNDSPSSPYSTVSRGRVIVDAESIDDGVADAEHIDDYVRQIAVERTMAAEYLTFTSLNMPGHNFKNCLLIDIPQYSIHGKYIEFAWEMDLSTNGLMMHRCNKVVEI